MAAVDPFRDLAKAASRLRTIGESDPEYGSMSRRFEQESRVNGSAQARLGRLFLAVPRAAYRVAECSSSALSSRSERKASSPVQQ